MGDKNDMKIDKMTVELDLEKKLDFFFKEVRENKINNEELNKE